MSNQVRLDRFLANNGVGSRAEVKKLIRAGKVLINGTGAVSGDRKMDPETDEVLVDGKKIQREVVPVIMLNKPAGVVSATEDGRSATVIDLIHEPWAKKLFPVGRLDKDTEGLLILTQDGAMAHELLSPTKHVRKTYFAVVSGAPDASLIDHFQEGIDIGEKRRTLPAVLVFLSPDGGRDTSAGTISESDYARCGADECCVLITITEGKFHQIKRMFAAFGREVHFLKRIAMGDLALDPSLSPGEYRPVTDEELKRLQEGRENG